MKDVKDQSNQPNQIDTTWPKLFNIRPKVVVLAIATWIAIAWAIFISIDILGWISVELRAPAWTFLFNDRPVEWTQWFMLAFAAGISGFLAGRLSASGEKDAAKFFFLIAIGFGLMLIEDAGDIRHVLNREAERAFGGEIFGLRHSFVVEAPYFLALAAVPVYAFARYWRQAWRAVSARKLFLIGFILYAMAAGGSLMSNLFHSYVIIGGAFDILFFGSNLPLLPGRTQGFTYFMFTDSVLEESIELMGITMLVAGILAFTREFRESSLAKVVKK